MRISQSAGSLLVGVIACASALGAQNIDPTPSPALAFVENQGQWDTPARYVARSGPLSVGLEPGALVLVVDERAEEEPGPHLVRLDFLGAREDARIEGLERQPGVRHYYLGNDPEKWRTGVASYARVLYRGLYEGVDLCVRDQDGELEYDLLLEPGVDLDQVRVRCEGIESLEVAPDGSLILHTGRGPLRQSPPTTWSVLPSDERREVECRFVPLGPDTFGFRAQDRDPELELVVDPGIEWCTYLGGSDDDQFTDGALDPFGRTVLVGRTYSADFPASGSLNGVEDAFVSLFAADGSSLVWSVYLGGDARDRALGVEVDAAGDVYVTGGAKSDFPVTPGAYDTTWNGAWDGFLTKLDGDDGTLLYSTFLGGAEKDWCVGLALTGPDSVTLVGTTYSTDLPTTSGCFQPGFAGTHDYFVTRLDLKGAGAAGLVYCTYLGGSGAEGAPNDNNIPLNMTIVDVDLDAAGDIFVTGVTASNNFPTTSNAYQATALGSVGKVAIVHLSPNGAGDGDLIYGTYVYSSSTDAGMAIAVAPSGVLTVGGYTYSANFPTTPGAYDTTFNAAPGRDDAFLLRLDPSLMPPDAQLLYSTFLGGEGWDSVLNDGLRLVGSGDVIAAGLTGPLGLANGFPTTAGAAQTVYGGDGDGFLIYLSPQGNGASDLKYSTFLGGSSYDWLGLAGVLPGPCVRVAVGGMSESFDFPTTAGAYQPTSAGGPEAAAAQILLTFPLVTYCTAGTSASGCQAAISSSGTPSASAPSGFDLLATGAEGNKNGLFFFGTSGRQANSWGDGTSYQCVVPPVKRAGLLMGTGTTTLCNGTFSQDLNALWTAAPAKNPGAGALVQAQLWYRDPLNTSSQPTSLSDAIEFTVCP